MKQPVRCPAGNVYDAAVHAECPCPSCWADRVSSALSANVGRVPNSRSASKDDPLPEVVSPQAVPSQLALELGDTPQGTGVGTIDFVEQPPNMSLGDILFSFEGRISNREFLLGSAISFFIFIAGLFIVGLGGHKRLSVSSDREVWLLTFLVLGICGYINTAVTAKRCHDLVGASSKMTLGRVLFSFEGEIGIGKFWLGGVISLFTFWASLAVLLSLAVIGERLFGVSGAALTALMMVISMWLFVLGIGMSIYMALAVAVKRCHDLNFSPWYLLWILFPYVGAPAMLIYLGAFPGKPADTSTDGQESAAPSLNSNTTRDGINS